MVGGGWGAGLRLGLVVGPLPLVFVAQHLARRCGVLGWIWATSWGSRARGQAHLPRLANARVGCVV